MDGDAVATCSICKDLAEDPRILPCAHSFCLKCLESSSLTVDCPKCPKCDVAFKIPQGGLTNLKKNEFIKYLKNLLLNKRNCNSCYENKAVNFCIDCFFNYCSTCLRCHGMNPASRNHRLLRQNGAATEESNRNKCQVCEVHSETINLYCEDCRMSTCATCFVSNHKKHEMKHVSDKFDEMKNYVRLKIAAKEKDVEITTDNFKNAEEMLDDCKAKAAELKKEIQQRGEAIKGLVDSIVAEMSENIDEELAQHEEEAGVVLKKLKEMQTDLNAQIETLKKQLSNLNYQNIAEISKKKSDKAIEIPRFTHNFKMYITPFAICKKSDFEETIGFLFRRTQLELLEEFCVANYSGSFAVGQDNFYVINGRKIDVFNASKFLYRSSIPLQYDLCISDIEVMNEILYVSGTNSKFKYLILKISNHGTNTHCIHKADFNGYFCKLSKLKNGNLIIAESKKIIVMSQDGDVIKTIYFLEHICNAVEFGDRHFVVCRKSSVNIVDDDGSTTFTFPVACGDNQYFDAAVDKFKNVLIYNSFTGHICIFNHHHALVSSYKTGRNISKIYYNKHTNALCTLTKGLVFRVFRLVAKQLTA